MFFFKNTVSRFATTWAFMFFSVFGLASCQLQGLNGFVEPSEWVEENSHFYEEIQKFEKIVGDRSLSGSDWNSERESTFALHYGPKDVLVDVISSVLDDREQQALAANTRENAEASTPEK